METKLKPCPCGCGVEVTITPTITKQFHLRHQCKGVFRVSEDFFERCAAVNAWNTRADDNRRCENCKYLEQCETLKAMGAAGLPVSYDTWHCADFTKRED